MRSFIHSLTFRDFVSACVLDKCQKIFLFPQHQLILSIFLFFFSGKGLIYKYPSCEEMLRIKMTGLLIIPLKVPHWGNHLWIDSGVLQIPNEGDGWRIFLYFGGIASIFFQFFGVGKFGKYFCVCGLM